MIVIHQVKIPCGLWQSQEQLLDILRERAYRKLRARGAQSPGSRDLRVRVLRHSVDARKKPALFDVYSVGVMTSFSLSQEKKLVEKLHDNQLSVVEPVTYSPPIPSVSMSYHKGTHRPVVIGFGPAGIFCALLLARAGLHPIVLERGKKMEERCKAMETFWQSGKLDLSANAQFGEGGAGTFSDGKLNTNATDKEGRTEFVLQTFVNAGAPDDILYEFHPHIGTDILRSVIIQLRQEITSLGGEIRFENRMDDLILAADDGRSGAAGSYENDGCHTKVTGVRVTSPEGTCILNTNIVVLAPGHSARDTFRMLHEKYPSQIPMSAKPFAAGLRVSHPQSLIDARMYGVSDPEELRRLHLPAASYKLTAKAADGHGVYSFCMCPGGYIVNASSSYGELAVNGMSNYARDSGRANSAIVVNISPDDYGTDDVLSGMAFQEELEKKAYALAGGKVPIERYADFERGNDNDESILMPSESLCIKGQYRFAQVHTILPRWMTKDFIEGMHSFERSIPGFTGPEAFVCGVESRTSSPVRIERDPRSMQSPTAGLYPCGEGAGYAGGITSAAIDGCKVAEAIIRNLFTL